MNDTDKDTYSYEHWEEIRRTENWTPEVWYCFVRDNYNEYKYNKDNPDQAREAKPDFFTEEDWVKLIKDNHKRWKHALKELHEQGGMDFHAVWEKYTKEFEDPDDMENESPDVKPAGNREGLDVSEEKEVDEDEAHYEPGQDTKQPFVPTHPLGEATENKDEDSSNTGSDSTSESEEESDSEEQGESKPDSEEEEDSEDGSLSDDR